MKVAQYIFIVLDLIACLGLIITVMLQESSASGGLDAFGGQSGSDTFYGSHGKRRSKEGLLKKLTTVFGISFAVFTIILYVLTGRGA
ncbi:MAG: preprotein translocase subunit SecG [Clostridiaceae bacterium]|jgi:protein translocase SecG subunit|nr:preprotein translocase subunit SecG [Clostridiaceae bacterium]